MEKKQLRKRELKAEKRELLTLTSTNYPLICKGIFDSELFVRNFSGRESGSFWFVRRVFIHFGERRVSKGRAKSMADKGRDTMTVCEAEAIGLMGFR